MRLSELEARLATVTDNLTGNKWSAKQSARALNDFHRSLVREMARLDEGYVNYRFTLALAAARIVHADEYSFRLPPWVMHVTGVRENQASSGSKQPLVPRARKYGAVGGWHFTGSNELTMYRMGQPRSFDVECSKLPALMTKGTLPAQTAMATNQMRIDADPLTTADYPHETEQNSYAGALFEITGPVSARVGQRLRCIGSVHDQSTAGTVLTFEEAWTAVPVVADTYEMHMEIPDQHASLVVLMAARRLFAQANLIPAIAAFAQDLAEEWSAFRRTIETRDLQEPYYIGSGPRDLAPIYEDMT